MSRRTLATSLLAAFLCLSANAQDTSLFAQSTQRGLDRTPIAYPSSRVHWLLMNIESRTIVASRWMTMNQPQPLGSLTKPVLVYAAGAIAPRILTASTQAGCTGDITLPTAIAFSCNAYFTAFASRIDPALLRRNTSILGLPTPPPNATGEDLIGLTTLWPIAPLAVANAYAHLITAHDPLIEQGMFLAAHQGTARALRAHNVLAKTGTAGCNNACFHHGNGFVVILAPATAPRYLLLVEAEGSTGAHAAELAEPMLQTLERLHAW